MQARGKEKVRVCGGCFCIEGCFISTGTLLRPMWIFWRLYCLIPLHHINPTHRVILTVDQLLCGAIMRFSTLYIVNEIETINVVFKHQLIFTITNINNKG